MPPNPEKIYQNGSHRTPRILFSSSPESTKGVGYDTGLGQGSTFGNNEKLSRPVIPVPWPIPSAPSLTPEKKQTEIKSEASPSSFWSLYGGICMALLASICFSSCFLMIKMLHHHGLKPFGAALLLNLGVLVPSILAIIYIEFGPGWENRVRILKGIWPLSKDTVLGYMTAQGLLQALSVILRSLSLRHMSVGDMTVIVFSSPIVTTILAHFVVGEECGLFFIFIAIFTLCGVGLVTKPPILTGAQGFDHETLIGSAFALGAMFALSTKFVVTRKIKDTHFLAMTFFLGLAGVVVSLPLYLIFEPHDSILPDGTGKGLFLRLGLFAGFGAISCINLALKMEDAGVVALVRSCDVIFAFILQYLFLGVVPDLLSAIGGTMVWTGVLAAGVRKYLVERKTRMHNKNKDCKSITEA